MQDITNIETGSVVVGYDGSTHGEAALQWGVDEARKAGRALTLLTAVGGPFAADAGRPEAQRQLDLTSDALARRAPALTVHTVVVEDDPRAALLAAARQAHLVVVGSHGRGPVRSRLLGSVGAAVTRHAGCPVVVVRPGHPGVVHRGVLVGVDGSAASTAPLELAFHHASVHGLPLTVVYVAPLMPPVGSPAFVVGGAPPELDETDDHHRALAEATAGLREKYPDVHVSTEVRRGVPGLVLADLGRRMDLLVVGAHAGGRASALLLGSTATTALEHARCPVAVVPVDGAVSAG
jgi:nucleotide-binding universal stress UspA family protein